MQEPLIIKAGYLWDGLSNKALPHGALLVEQGRIKAIGPADEISTIPHKQVYDWPEATILPGLIDCHTHLSMDPNQENYLDHLSDNLAEQTLRATAMMRKDLLSGITTVRSCGDKEFLDIACKNAIESGLIGGPGLLVATRGIRAPQGHGFVGYPFDGIEQIRKAIRQNLLAGADFIKIYITGTLRGKGDLPSFLSRKEIEAAIEESHKAGVRIAAHCIGGVGLDWALEAGLDTIEHVYHITDSQIEKLGESNTWPVLTPSPLLTESRVRNLPKDLIPGHFAERNEITGRMAALINSGMDFALGSDGMHGELAQEATYLVEMGASPLTALKAATLNAAKACAIEDKTGSFEIGKQADILIVKGNPLENIQNLKKVIAVFKNGVPVCLNNSIPC
jgi:imidazolonepropionase-like amidohydrolase